METYSIDGISVDHEAPAQPRLRPPVIFVHGGSHGSWCWENYQHFFSERGWDTHAINLFNHGNSRKLSTSEFVHRSVADSATELSTVQNYLGETPILIGHSMGALASLAYAAKFPVSKLVLMSPSVPAEIGLPPMDIPYDLEQPWGPIDFGTTQQAFYPTLDEATAHRYYDKLVPESAQAIYEVTRHTLSVNLSLIHAPTFVTAVEFDFPTPVEGSRKLAKQLGARYAFYEGVGHCEVLLKEGAWQSAAGQIEAWLRT